MTACPPPVSNTLATVVADKIPPTLTITSPKIGQSYTANVTFTGTVSDDAVSPGDGKGTLRYVGYSVANNVLLRGRILINQDGTTQQVPSYGSGVISWTHAAKSFSFSFSTATPSPLHGLLSVTIDVSDANGNVTTQIVQLSEGTGPLITLSSPVSPNLSYVAGTTSITLTGTLANAVDDPGSASNISSLAWGVTGKTWGAALDLAAGQTSVANTGFSVNENFTYTAATRTFTTSFVVPFINDTQLILTVSATDYNGHATTNTTVLVANVSGPQLSLMPTNGLYYSSTSFAPLTVSGAILSSELSTVKAVTYRVVGSGFSSNVVTVYENIGTPTPANFFDASGNFSFSLSDPSASLSGRHGTAQVTITIPNQSNISTVAQFTITEDSTPPSVTGVTVTSNNANNAYAKAGDTVTLAFQAADSGCGLAGNPTVTIEGPGAAVTPLGGGSFSAQHVMLVTDTSDANVSFVITATDAIGNAAPVTTAASNVKYYVNAPTLSSVTMASDSSTNTAYAKTGDTVTLSFTSPRDLQSAAAVSLAGHSSLTPAPASLTAHAYTAAWKMTGTDTEEPILFSLTITDAAGNPPTTVSAVTAGSAVVFDRTPPSGYTVSTAPYVNDTGKTSMSFTVNGLEASGSHQYSISDGTSTIGPTAWVVNGSTSVTVSSVNVSTLADTTLTIQVWEKDAAGNPGLPPASTTTMKDTVPPSITGIAMNSDNTRVQIDFNTGVYGNPGAAILFNSLEFNDTTPPGTTTVTPSAIDPAISGGATSATFVLSWGTPPNPDDVITVTVVGVICDAAGNALTGTFGDPTWKAKLLQLSGTQAHQAASARRSTLSGGARSIMETTLGGAGGRGAAVQPALRTSSGGPAQGPAADGTTAAASIPEEALRQLRTVILSGPSVDAARPGFAAAPASRVDTAGPAADPASAHVSDVPDAVVQPSAAGVQPPAVAVAGAEPRAAAALEAPPVLPTVQVDGASADASPQAPSGWSIGLGALAVGLLAAGAWMGFRFLRERAGRS